MTGGMHPVAITHRSLHGRECLIRPQDLPACACASQHLQLHAIPWYARQEKAAQKHAANGWDDGCGAHGRYLYPVGMDGSMQLATAAQRRKNLDAIHGAKRVKSNIAFVNMSW